MLIHPTIAELKDKLKDEKKKVNGIYKKVRQYMEEEKVESLEFCGFTFEITVKEHCPFNEKNLEEVIQDKAIIEKYKERFSKEKTSFKIAKAKV